MSKIAEDGKAYLRIKIKHLALEPELVRHEMQRARRLQAYKLFREWQDSDAVKGKAEIAIPPQWTDPWLAVALDKHRKQVIRPEARAAQLAYAFLRGKPYLSVEQKGSLEPDWRRVAEIALKFGTFPDSANKKNVEASLKTWAAQDQEATPDAMAKESAEAA